MFVKINRVLNQKLKRTRGGEQIIAAQILSEFNRIIKKTWGDKALKRIKPLYVKNRRLTVSALSSVAAAEIKLREDEIVREINRKIGHRRIEGLRFMS
jgi:hypothetical protein